MHQRYYTDEWEEAVIISSVNEADEFKGILIRMRNDIIDFNNSSFNNIMQTENLPGTPSSSIQFKYTFYYRER
jgi:hypothetical protein